MHYRRSRGALAMLVIVLPVWLFNAMKVWRCSRHDWPPFLKVHEIKKSDLPSLATSCENMASKSERIMERSKNFQIVYVGPQTFVNIAQLTMG